MKVLFEWYDDSEHVLVDTEMDHVPFPGDSVHLGDDNVPIKHVVRRTWVRDENSHPDSWHVELILR